MPVTSWRPPAEEATPGAGHRHCHVSRPAGNLDPGWPVEGEAGQAVTAAVGTLMASTSGPAGTRRSWTSPSPDRISRWPTPMKDAIAANWAHCPSAGIRKSRRRLRQAVSREHSPGRPYTRPAIGQRNLAPGGVTPLATGAAGRGQPAGPRPVHELAALAADAQHRVTLAVDAQHPAADSGPWARPPRCGDHPGAKGLADHRVRHRSRRLQRRTASGEGAHGPDRSRLAKCCQSPTNPR
jgi:hypothetical protein